MRPFLCIAAAAGLCAGGLARADILAHWTFETSVPTTAGPHAAELGVNAAGSQATGFHVDQATVYSNPVGNGSVESFSSNTWSVGDYYQFTTATQGYQNITIQFDQTRSSTGPGTFDVEYSLDGTTFFQLVNDYAIDALSWSSLTPQPLSTFGPHAGPPALDNQPTIWFRLTNQVAPGGTGGTNRIDDVIISGDVIPTPGAAALLGLGGLVALRRRRN